MQWSVVLLFVAAASLIWLENRDKTNVNKIKVKAAASSYTKQDLIKKIDEIPSWVKFPDRERAEWLNQVIAQFWPTLNNYIVKIFRGSIQNKIRKKYESFRFESIDFGCNVRMRYFFKLQSKHKCAILAAENRRDQGLQFFVDQRLHYNRL
jgi:hypothetical protein